MLDTMRPSYAAWAIFATFIVACASGSGGADITANEEALRKSRVEWTTFEDPKGVEHAGVAATARLIRSESGYRRIFGHDYRPEPYIESTYQMVRKHKWYGEARMVTVNDLYAFDANAQVSLEPFIDIIGRHFKQPKEGLGYDNSPVAHMWRTIERPDAPL